MYKYNNYTKKKVENRFSSKVGFLRCSKLVDNNKNTNTSSTYTKSQYLSILSSKECNCNCEKNP